MRVRVGDVNEALRALERGFDAREPAILSGLNHPRWDPLRGSPRFQALSQRSKLTAARNLQSMVSRPLSDVAVSQ